VKLVVQSLVAGIGVLFVSWALLVDRQWFEVHTTPHYCFERTEQVARAAVERWSGAALGVLLVVAVPFAGRWAGHHSARHVMRAVARVVAAVLLALVACEIILRLRKAPEGVMLHYEPDSEGDERFVYRAIRSHTTEHHLEAKTLRFVIDANGYRVRDEHEVIDFDRPTMIFAGESITSGFGLNYEETHPAMLSERFGVQVVNIGVQGYGNDGAYMRLHEELPRFRRVLATVTLVVHIAVERNTWPGRPHLVIRDDGTSFLEPSTDGASLRLLPIAESLYHSSEALRRERALLSATARESQEHGALAVFVLTNSGPLCQPDDSGQPSADRTIFDGLGLTHVRVDLGPDSWDTTIKHPGVRAQEAIADALERILRERGVRPNP
jgi:hypothetical protein